MPGLIDWIRLSQIFLDPLFRCEEDTRLTADIRKNKLDNPLIVEGPINDHYILVDGYKRYISLVHLGWESVQCTIEP
ncbi:MAG: ParB N-terminal domain-containing protein [Desulfosporosinus sp.]|nr:ParB N-terminal domain-containing protein [Desulfosporosinus sp.]